MLGLLGVAPAAQAQGFGIESFTGMVFADESRDRTDSYTNTGTPGGRITDAYPDPSTGGTGIYELAGGHPFIGVTDFSFSREASGAPAGGNVEQLRVDIPKGLMPNPKAFDRCTDAQLESFTCPTSSQIGTEELTLYIGALSAPIPGGLGFGDIKLRVPLYNMTPLSNPEDEGPRQDVVARFAFHPGEAGNAILAQPDAIPSPLSALATALLDLHSVHIVGGVRDQPSQFGPFDYGLYFTIDHLPAYDGTATSPGVIRTNLTFWGVPGDAANDEDPGGNPQRNASCVTIDIDLPLLGNTICTPVVPPGEAPDPDVPFLTNPTECTGQALVGRLTVWSHPQDAEGTVVSDARTDQTPEIVDRDDGTVKSGAQECQQLPFGAGLEVLPDVTAPDSPTGPTVTQTVPQDGLADKDVFAASHIDDLSVTLPPGMTLNPSAANGLEACTDAQFAAAVGQPGGEACPPASRIGDVSAISPLLPPAADEPPDSTPVVTGSAYVGQPLTGDQYRLFVTLETRGVSIRLKGSVRPDARTGQLTAVFADNPQLPFSDLTVDLRDGPRAPLATPLDCGPKTASARLVPWSGTPAITPTSAPFQIAGAGCPAGFQPSFAASSADPRSGALAPFAVAIGRGDRNQFLSGVRIDTPPGLAAMISSVEQCPDAQAATGACPASSRIGTATTLAGAGPEPYRLTGPVYLTESYDGSPFGMVAVIRAIAGPYDLGTVVVRQKIFVDSEDAHITVVSDPLPQILEGVPIRLRNVHVSLDREGFAFNPSSCGARAVGATLHSLPGTAAGRRAGVRFTGCERLGFEPKLAMKLLGARQMRFGRHPGLFARVRQSGGPGQQANIAKARVKLPRSIALDPDNSQNVCSVEAAQRADCPKRTRIGFARAISPALNEPLKGPVYLVQGIRVDPETGNEIRTLPDLLAKLGGEVRINLRGKTDVVGKRSNLVSTFEPVPDAPVSRFDMRVKGGKKGILVVTTRKRGACGPLRFSRARFIGHNTKRAGGRVKLVRPCANPRLRLRRVQPRGNRLVVRGTLAKRARKRPRVAVRCGKARVVKRAKRNKGRGWRAVLPLRGRCARADRAKLRVAYPGGGKFRPVARGRRVSL